MEIRNDQNHNYLFLVLIPDKKKVIGFKGNVNTKLKELNNM